MRKSYTCGYSLNRLREHAAKRRHYDRYSDLWQGLGIAFSGLAKGQPALGLPALGGLFTAEQCLHLDGAQLENRYLLQAVFGLCFFREGAALTRVNYRDMGSEELGSVYESLLELVPVVSISGGSRRFTFVGDEEKASTKGNARKLSGSYYTPDSLVQELIKSALEPVIAQTLQANLEQPVKALLGLTVCDPACGSGHFLLAAARRIAEEVARLNASEGNPLQSDYRHALREVVAHCIYGVDKNQMAVELAKTALWLEAYTPDRPLTFLDHHLRCGDALLGVLDPAILEKGIPGEAFNALSGDDKAVVKALKKANSDALKAIEKSKANTRNMLSLGLEEATEIRNLEALPDDTLEAIAAKRAAFAQVEVHAAQSRARIAADLFAAAFVMPKTPANQSLVPTSQDLWLVMNGSAPRPGVQAAAMQAAHTAQAFHWHLSFPQIFSPGSAAILAAGGLEARAPSHAPNGFDVLLGNPPWERIKLQEEEFFATRSPLVAESQHKAERGQRIDLLKQGMLLHTLYPEVEAAQGLMPPNQAEQQLYAEFLSARRSAEASSLYAHDAGRYPLTGVGDVNTYALFAETYSQLVSTIGRSGFIVPTGIATDDSTSLYFGSLVSGKRLSSLFDFENRGQLFPGLHTKTKFCLITLSGAPVDKSSLCFMATKLEDLNDHRKVFAISPSDLAMINPNSKTTPIFRSRKDAEIVMKIYVSVPVLIKRGDVVDNKWGVSYCRHFDMSTDSGLFLTQGIFDTSPLYEAKMFWHFDHRWATFDDPNFSLSEDAQKIGTGFVVKPRYWVRYENVESRLSQRNWGSRWLIVFRNVSDSRNERTFVATVIPRYGVGHSASILMPNIKTAKSAACLTANFNSLVLDFIARQKIPGMNISYFMVDQLPVLPPDRYTDADLAFIVPRVLELTYTAHDLKPWAEDLGYNGEPFAWNPDRRAVLRAELDAYYARLYGLTRDELRYILDPADVMGDDYPSETFRVLKNSEMREFGEYRTRRLVLAAWDRLESGELRCLCQ